MSIKGGNSHCLEVIVIKGRTKEIEGLSIGIGGLRGVKFAKLNQDLTFFIRDFYGYYKKLLLDSGLD